MYVRPEARTHFAGAESRLSGRISVKRREHLAALLVFISASLTNLTGFAQESSKAAKIREIGKVLETYHEYGQFQGAALVGLHGEVIYRKGFGLANLEWGIPNTPETRYSIASHGKAFTAVLIMQLVEKKELDLHVPIAKYLPAYRKDNAEKVTIHHLLRHTSGVPGVPSEWSETQNRNPYTLDRLVELANLGELEFEPGTRFAYSNNGYNLLAAIIERVTGQTYEQVLQERILDPLGMKDTGLVKHQPILARRASNYNRLFWGELLNAPYMDESFAVGAGGMYSTVDDMFKWDQALRSDKLLSPASRELLFTPGLGDAGYGWGVGIYTTGGDGNPNTLVYGFGGTNGAASVTYRLIEDNHLIVLLGNIRQVPQARIASNLTNILVDVPLNPISPPRDEELYRRIMDDGIDEAVKAYGGMRDDPAVQGLPNENRINEMGYELLQYGRVADAIEIFRFNVAAHPQYANGFDSLGEAYEKNNQLRRARDSYGKALRLGREADDPNTGLYKANRDRVARRLPQRPCSAGRGNSRRAAPVLRVLDASAGQVVADIGF